MVRRILFYLTENGTCPVQEFLDSLPEKAFQKVVWVLNLITELQRIPTTFFKKLRGSEDIWECRIQFGAETYRLFGFFNNGSLVVLTHGIKKKSRKTPGGEIRRAENLRKAYLRRFK